MNNPEFSRPIPLDRIGVKEKSFDIAANDAELKAMATRLGIPAVKSLDAKIALKMTGGGKLVRLSGHVRAQLVQICVVTLEPMDTEIDESFTRSFSVEAEEEEGGDIIVTLDSDDPPDPVEDGQIDIGEAVAEQVALAMDPFPRAPGAAFEPPPEEAAEEPERPSPFAKLAEARKKE